MLLGVTVALSGCVAGKLVRLATWGDDPTPFWVVVRENGPCAVVFGDLLLLDDDSYFREANVTGDGRVGCESAYVDGRKFGMPNAMAFFSDIPPDELDRSEPTRSRRGPRVVYEAALEGEAGTARSASRSLYLGIDGRRLGSSPFCNVKVRATWMRAVYNAGDNKDVHVLIGEGNRVCGGP